MICKSSLCRCARCGSQGYGDREAFLIRLQAKEAEKQKRMAAAPKKAEGGYKA